MPLQSSSDLLRGGLDLVTPAMALDPGTAIAALNYEPEARGYRRIGGYERYDGQASPSLGANAEDAAARRVRIKAVPGRGPVRGVAVFAGHLYAFRDADDGSGGMWRAETNGWVRVAFGHVVAFNSGTEEIVEGGSLLGGTSKAIAKIERVVLQSGQWNGTAAGYLVVSDLAGQFASGETAEGSSGGNAKVLPAEAVLLPPGGRYEFLVHNFYGSAKNACLYGVNGIGSAFEFSGTSLRPIRTGTTAGGMADVIAVMTRNGSMVTTRDGAGIGMRQDFDRPTHVAQFSNHLFLAFDAGSLIHSGIGEPLDFRATAGAGEISFGVPCTGLLSSAATSLVIFAQSRVDYLTGSDNDTFDVRPISDAAGAARWTTQTAGEAPVYLDEGGLRRMTTTAAFGDWRMGTVSQLVEPLIRAKREAGAVPIASFIVKNKDQYRLFFDDGTGLVLYLGRKNPEIMPVRMGRLFTCAVQGEFREGEAERIFVGSDDGFVYEIDRGPSFDGSAVPAYVRLAWNSLRAPMLEKRFQSVRIETENRDPMRVGITYQVDYTAGGDLGGVLADFPVAPGSPDLTPAGDPYGSVDWMVASAGEIHAPDLCGLGRNIAITVLSEHTLEQPHTLTAMALFFAPRRQLR